MVQGPGPGPAVQMNTYASQAVEGAHWSTEMKSLGLYVSTTWNDVSAAPPVLTRICTEVTRPQGQIHNAHGMLTIGSQFAQS